MATFVLLHGAWHGGWCWEPLRPELAARGHDCVAPDLPAGRDDGIEACVDAVAAAVPEGRGDLVVVGHSLGGVLVPVLAERLGARHMVFVCGLLAGPGESMDEVIARDGDVFSPGWPELAARQTRTGDGGSAWPPDAAVAAFYDDCPPAAARSAAARLRPQYWRVMQDPSPLAVWPRVPATSVVCRADRVVNPVWSRRVSREVLGVGAVELEGGHSPFLSRPAATASLLASLLAPGGADRVR